MSSQTVENRLREEASCQTDIVEMSQGCLLVPFFPCIADQLIRQFKLLNMAATNGSPVLLVSVCFMLLMVSLSRANEGRDCGA